MSDSGHLGGCWLEGDPNTFMPDVWEYLLTQYGIQSVLDVGCGAGWSTKWFVERGIDTLGIEGWPEAIDKNQAKDHVVLHDYTLGPYVPGRAFDLCWCAEFVEHVEEKFLDNFMRSIAVCHHACITHAFPGQGGYHHVNERDDAYWIEVFAAYGLSHVRVETYYLRALSPVAVPWGRNSLMFFQK